MAGLPTDVSALVRAGHVTSAVIWLGLVYFLVFVRPAVFAKVADATRREMMPRLARAVLPWFTWSSTLTMLFGFILYADLGLDLGFANIRWGTTVGASLAVVMFLLGHAVVLPVLRASSRALEGRAMPGPGRIRVADFVGRINAYLGFAVLFFMIVPPRVSWLQ